MSVTFTSRASAPQYMQSQLMGDEDFCVRISLDEEAKQALQSKGLDIDTLMALPEQSTWCICEADNGKTEFIGGYYDRTNLDSFRLSLAKGGNAEALSWQQRAQQQRNHHFSENTNAMVNTKHAVMATLLGRLVAADIMPIEDAFVTLYEHVDHEELGQKACQSIINKAVSLAKSSFAEQLGGNDITAA